MSNIFRVEKDKNYTVINNNYLRDKNLRLESIGLMTIILSLPNDYKINMNNLVKLTKENYRTIKLILNELSDNGYVQINRQRDEKGHFYYDYIFFESNQSNPLYKNCIPVHNNFDIINVNNNISKPITNSPPTEKCEVYINTIDNKIKKDKNNLFFLTNYLIEWNFIKKNDTYLYKYNDFLIEFSNNNNDTKLTINIIYYVVNNIKSNKYLDENLNPINNLFIYFKESCINNLDYIINLDNIKLYD